MFDIAHGDWNDKNGPVEISPIGDGTEFISWKYANGVVMTSEPFDEKLTKGVKFWGESGWIEYPAEISMHRMPNSILLHPPDQLKKVRMRQGSRTRLTSLSA